jgi:hypothetical protein
MTRNKLDGKGNGFLPGEHEVQSIPFEECTVDLIEPWKIQICGKPHRFEEVDVPTYPRSQAKNPSQDPKSRSQAKILNQKQE